MFHSIVRRSRTSTALEEQALTVVRLEGPVNVSIIMPPVESTVSYLDQPNTFQTTANRTEGEVSAQLQEPSEYPERQ